MTGAQTDQLEEARQLFRAGDAERAAGRWSAALEAYGRAAAHISGMPELHHNLALCQLALARPQEALRESELALGLKPALWQAHLVRIKALRSLGRAPEALAALRAMPAVKALAVEQELISLSLHELGDAAAALRLAREARAAFPAMPAEAAADVELNALIGRLYDPGAERAESLAAAFQDYARRHLDAPPAAPAKRAAVRRKRVGIVSPQLYASPVYFFGIGALRRLAAHADLVFFQRGAREDWATGELRAIAADWVEAAPFASGVLERELRGRALDAVIDMGGWMDRAALAALAGKPAAKMYKWVGGQPLTTGLAGFDGFLGDRWQSPPETQALYSEPLLRLECGYVTYTPPPYMPAPRPADPGLVLGVISNPVKASRAFLTTLAELIGRWRAAGAAPEVRLIDKRYRHAELRARIAAALGDAQEAVRFIAPADHSRYLAEVARLGAVIDTFPYSGGLTTMEALSLGVPCRTRAGSLFCERHSWAHCKYAGMPEDAFEMRAGWEPAVNAGAARASLVPAGSPRANHDALAAALLELIES